MKKIILFCFLLTSFNSFAQVDIASNLSDTEKIWGLTNFYTEAKYNFAFFDQAQIDWDSAYQAYIPLILATNSTWDYYQEMKKFCALLKDGHTNIYEPNSLYKSSRYKSLRIQNINKRFFIVNAPKGSNSKDIIGSEIISINGEPSEEWARKNLLPYISASTEHQLWNDVADHMFYSTDSTDVRNLELKTLKGKTIHYDKTSWHTYRTDWARTSPEWKRFNYKKIGNTGYLEINTFGDPEVIDDFKSIVQDLRSCKNIIIDLRRNGGGNSEIGAEILKYFTSQEIIKGSVWRTREHLPSYKAWGTWMLKDMPVADPDTLSDWDRKLYLMAKGDFWHVGDTMQFINDLQVQRLEQPLIVLMGNNTASAAEDFLVMLNQIPNRAKTIGQKSYGSTGQPLFIDLPGGGKARICTKRDTYPDGKEFVGYGIVPDIEIEKNIEDLIKGKDTELELALKEFRKKPLVERK